MTDLAQTLVLTGGGLFCFWLLSRPLPGQSLTDEYIDRCRAETEALRARTAQLRAENAKLAARLSELREGGLTPEREKVIHRMSARVERVKEESIRGRDIDLDASAAAMREAEDFMREYAEDFSELAEY